MPFQLTERWTYDLETTEEMQELDLSRLDRIPLTSSRTPTITLKLYCDGVEVFKLVSPQRDAMEPVMEMTMVNQMNPLTALMMDANRRQNESFPH
jgi:hypothetical protein